MQGATPGRTGGLDVSALVTCDVFRLHLAAVRSHEFESLRAALKQSPSYSGAVLQSHEENLLLSGFAKAARQHGTVSGNEARAIVLAATGVTSPPDDETLNTLAGLPEKRQSYTWNDVKQLALSGKRHAVAASSVTDPCLDTECTKPDLSDVQRWTRLIDVVFHAVSGDECSPVVSTERALLLFSELLPSQHGVAVRHATSVRLQFPEMMTLEEFERAIIFPLRAYLTKEPCPGAPSREHNGNGVMAAVFAPLFVAISGKKDSSSVASSLSSLALRHSRSARLSKWVVNDPKGYFQISPCVVRQADVWHLLQLRVPLLQKWLLRLRKSAGKGRLRPAQLCGMRCVERAIDIIQKHADRCDRCQWFVDAAARSSPKRDEERSAKLYTPRPPQQHVPTVSVRRAAPFTPRVCPPNSARTAAAKRLSTPLQLNESLFVATIHKKALASQLL